MDMGEEMVWTDELKSFLDEAHDRYNTSDFVEKDPIGIPHRFSKKEDIELSAFFAALIAWGRRDTIIKNANRLMELMDQAPFDFIMGATGKDLLTLTNFIHRTFQGADAISLVKSLKTVYAEHGGLEAIFANGISPNDPDVYNGILHARQILLSHPEFAPRTHKHIANPQKGSSAKRINMYLRWMVRTDKRGVDFGIWKEIKTSQLLIPLDVHTGTIGRKLGLLHRKQNDWKAVQELTQNLRLFCAEDPVKYDFSLFGLGAYGDFT